MYSVILHSGEGIPLRAFVKVPKLSDAHLAILKVHQKKIFNTHVTVNIATEKEKELCFLRCEVTSILKEAPLHFLPLNKFLNDYYEKCSHAFDMSSIGLIHDLVVIMGKPGNQAISLITRAIGTVKVSIKPEQFANNVHALLKSCEGAIPLVSFAATYWLQFDKMIELSDSGDTLAEVLCNVPNVKVTDSLMVSWAKQAIRNGMQAKQFMCWGNKQIRFWNPIWPLIIVFLFFVVLFLFLVFSFRILTIKLFYNPFLFPGFVPLLKFMEIPEIFKFSSGTLKKSLKCQLFFVCLMNVA